MADVLRGLLAGHGDAALDDLQKTSRGVRAANSGSLSWSCKAKPCQARVHRKPGQMAFTRMSWGA